MQKKAAENNDLTWQPIKEQLDVATEELRKTEDRTILILLAGMIEPRIKIERWLT